MSGAITGMGTTYNLPNFTGDLIAITPADTPFLTATGGLSGGGQVQSTEMEWETYDLRAAGQNVALEGQAAPTATARVRGNVTNVVEVHQSKTSVSYSKLAAIGLKSGSNNALPNPVQDESVWQQVQELKSMARDVEYAFINGLYQKPSDNTTPRKTRGLLAAITTNLITEATITSTGLSAATDTITESSTGVSNDDKIVFSDVGASTAIYVGRVYFVVSKTTNAFKVALTSGGSAITIGTATVSYRKPWTTALANTNISTLLQSVYDNGGISETGTATIMTNSTQKLAITSAYMSAYGKYFEQDRNVGGVNVKTIETDFGTLNVMLNRFIPQDTIIVTSLEQCMPVFLETPGKGHFFAEPLAKTGASDDVQLYGEVGLKYGNEKAHGALQGLAV